MRVRRLAVDKHHLRRNLIDAADVGNIVALHAPNAVELQNFGEQRRRADGVIVLALFLVRVLLEIVARVFQSHVDQLFARAALRKGDLRLDTRERIQIFFERGHVGVYRETDLFRHFDVERAKLARGHFGHIHIEHVFMGVLIHVVAEADEKLDFGHIRHRVARVQNPRPDR